MSVLFFAFVCASFKVPQGIIVISGRSLEAVLLELHLICMWRVVVAHLSRFSTLKLTLRLSNVIISVRHCFKGTVNPTVLLDDDSWLLLLLSHHLVTDNCDCCSTIRSLTSFTHFFAV